MVGASGDIACFTYWGRASEHDTSIDESCLSLKIHHPHAGLCTATVDGDRRIPAQSTTIIPKNGELRIDFCTACGDHVFHEWTAKDEGAV